MVAWDNVSRDEVVRAIKEYDQLGPDQFATGRRLASGDFEGGKTGAVKVLGNLGFTVVQKGEHSKA
jgi:hypothetical protein